MAVLDARVSRAQRGKDWKTARVETLPCQLRSWLAVPRRCPKRAHSRAKTPQPALPAGRRWYNSSSLSLRIL